MFLVDYWWRTHIQTFNCHFVFYNFTGNLDFEHGFGTWKNMQGDNFDWLIGKGTTNSQHTGPYADHTKGNGDGKLIQAGQK